MSFLNNLSLRNLHEDNQLVTSLTLTHPILNFVSAQGTSSLIFHSISDQDASHLVSLTLAHPILNFVSALPKELKEEIVKYSRVVAFVLDKTGLFPVDEHISANS